MGHLYTSAVHDWVSITSRRKETELERLAVVAHVLVNSITTNTRCIFSRLWYFRLPILIT